MEDHKHKSGPCVVRTIKPLSPSLTTSVESLLEAYKLYQPNLQASWVLSFSHMGKEYVGKCIKDSLPDRKNHLEIVLSSVDPQNSIYYRIFIPN
jgi:hypothetical protein